MTRLSALRKDSVTAELDFNTVEGATHYVIRRESKDENSQTPSVREFITNQTHFIDRSIDSSHAYTYTVKAMLGDRSTPVSDPASIDAFSELMDDRDNASSTALPLEIGLTQNYLVEQRNTPISQMEITPIRMRLQPSHSMALVLKSTDSSHLNWDLLMLKLMASLLENLTSIQQEQLKRVY